MSEKISWTKSQQKAIDERNKNLIISAAAGSGKTAVLTQRIVDLIEKDKKDISSMLVLTFTKAAAFEMKNRIQKKLSDDLEKNPDNLHLSQQVAKSSTANISTMHSFCIDLLKENFEYLNIDPSFSVGSTATTAMMRAECINQIFLQKYESDDKAFLNLVNTFSAKGDDKVLTRLVYKIYDFVQSKKDMKSWLNEQAEKYNDSNQYLEILKLHIKEKISTTLETTQKLSVDASNFWQPYYEAIKNDEDFLEKISTSIDTDYDEYVELISNFKFKTLGRSKDKNGDELQKQRIKKIRDSIIKTAISDLKGYSAGSKEMTEYMQKTYPIVKALIDLTLEFMELYSQVKKEKSIFDFSDLEHFTLTLLDDEQNRNKIKENYEYIFYDEYQDSNEVQDSIIESLKSDDNLFFVGDVKQSIYGFRLAYPQNFVNRYESYQTDKNSEKIDLSENFRSSKQILDFNNKIFEKIMVKQTSLLEYDSSQRLVFPKTKDLNKENNDKNNIQVNLISLEKNDMESDKENLDEPTQELQNDELMAEFTAKSILKLVESDKKVSFKDIVILRRSLAGVSQTYETVFKKYNIPLSIDYSSGKFDVIEVAIFIDLLRIVDNIYQDIPMLSVMMSGIFNFSAEEITQIKIFDKEEKFFYKSAFKYEKENDDDLSKKLSQFFEQISRYSSLQNYMPLDEFIEFLLHDTYYEDFVKTMPGGSLRLDNLDTVKIAVKDFMKSENKTLFYFLIYIYSILTNKSDSMTAKNISDSQNIVRMMTVHKSKGLEFEVVYLNDIQKKINRTDTSDAVLIHSQLGIGLDYTDVEQRYKIATLPKKLISETMKKEQISEEIRILYVALTRAKKKLIINAILDSSANKTYSDIIQSSLNRDFSDMKSFFDFILFALSEQIIDESIYSQDLFNFSIISYEDIVKSLSAHNSNKYYSLDELVYSTAEKNADFIEKKYIPIYTNKVALDTLAKVSVTSLSKTPDSYLLEPTKEYVPYNSTQVDKKQVGTLNHLFLMTLDFTKKYDINSLKSHLEDMVAKKFIKESEKELIELKNIYEFTQSDFYKRIGNSNQIFKEESFITKYKGSLLTGIIDLFFVEGDHIVLIDYKTDDVTEQQAPDHAKIYSKQLFLYKQAIETAFEKKVAQCFIYFLSINKKFEINL